MCQAATQTLINYTLTSGHIFQKLVYLKTYFPRIIIESVSQKKVILHNISSS